MREWDAKCDYANVRECASVRERECEIDRERERATFIYEKPMGGHHAGIQ